MAASSQQVLRLYRTLLREAQGFTQYNYRHHAIRRIREQFKDNKSLTEQTEIANSIAFAKEQLEVIRRQVVLGKMYGLPGRLVVE
eukprot:m.12753 g.12753  ORF g.12753 m.12753 type:complete len:85 (-) comp4352_c0_seq1:88-342(-)